MTPRTTTPSPRRQRARRYGQRAETLCALVLMLKGYRVLARGFRVPSGEIDIVARRAGTVVFVEVKARAGAGGREAITARQRRRVVRAAEAFLQRRPALATHGIRFDVMVVDGLRLPEHIVDAWRPEG
jgi:putative endonuclease